MISPSAPTDDLERRTSFRIRTRSLTTFTGRPCVLQNGRLASRFLAVAFIPTVCCSCNLNAALLRIMLDTGCATPESAGNISSDMHRLVRRRGRRHQLRGLLLVGSKCVCPQCKCSLVMTWGRYMPSAMDLPVYISRSQELTRNANNDNEIP